MKFEVAYRTADGRMCETTIDVADRNAVYSELRRQGIAPLSLREADGKRKTARAARGVGAVLRLLLLFALFAVAAFTAWYGLVADEGTKRHLRHALTPSTRVDMFRHGDQPEKPRKGTGTVRMRIAE